MFTYLITYVYIRVLGGLFNESWVELDAEVKALERRRGFGVLTAE
jgi:hypothetical protein